jgi:hypothetical protein
VANRAASGLHGGYAEALGWPPERYDQQQLAQGTQVEREHTSDPQLARQIAMDHLAEQILKGEPQDYYTKLELVESHAEQEPAQDVAVWCRRPQPGPRERQLLASLEQRLADAKARGDVDEQLELIEDIARLESGALRPGDGRSEGGTASIGGLQSNAVVYERGAALYSAPEAARSARLLRRLQQRSQEHLQAGQVGPSLALERPMRRLRRRELHPEMAEFERLEAQMGPSAELASNKKWSRAYIDRLPDSAFFWVAPGGERDKQGRTHPLHLRSLPYRDHAGHVNYRHVVNALSRLRGTQDIPESRKPELKRRICRVLEQQGGQCSSTAYRRNRKDNPTEGLQGLRMTPFARWEGERHMRYGSWYDRPAGEWFVSNHLCYSDYSGGLVNVANYRAFLREFVGESEDAGELPSWLMHLSGDFATQGLAVEVAGAPPEVWEFLGALEDYPLADDELLSELEQEASEEAWERWARADFVKAVANALGYELDECPDEVLAELFRETAESAGVYWENQDGPDMWIDVERVAAALAVADLPDCARPAEQED